MNTHVSRALYGALFVGGLSLLGATAANAADTSGEDGILSGTQIVADVTAPITAGGNAISILGDSSSSSAAPAAAPVPAPAAPAPAAPAPATTSGLDGVLSGTQGLISVAVPITVEGNSISVVGDSSSTGTPAAAPAPAPAAPAPVAPATTNGEDSVAGGTQALIDVNLPITVGGNAISVLGDTEATSTGSAPAEAAPATTAPAAPAAGGTTSGEDSIAGGTQIVPVVDVPVTVGGNAISVLGDSEATNTGNTGTTTPAVGTAAAPAAGGSTTGEDSVAGGTQIVPVVDVPVTVGGNAVSVLGDSEATSTNTSGTTGTSTPAVGTPAAPAAGGSTTGEDSILGGTQIVPVVDVPVNVGGNAISVLGDSEATSTNTSGTTGTTTPAAGTPAAPAAGGTTTGEDSILGGTQIIPVVDVPVNVGGNAISVLGDSEATNTGTTGTTTPVAGTPAAPAAGGTTTGDDSVAGGTQIIPVVNVPVNVGGNAVSVIGDSESTTTGTIGTPTTGTPTGTPVTGGTTTGDDSILGGTQIIPVINLPIDLGGNAISVIGDTDTTTTVTAVPTAPTDPTTPTDPTDPTTPVDPTDPTTPVIPTDPTTPVIPTDPTDPTTPVDPTEPATDTTDPTDTTGTTGVTGTSVPTVTLAAAGGSTVVVADASAELATTGVEIGNLGGIAILILLMGSLLLIARRWATQRG
jgi:uncharacterized protein YceK